MVTTTVVIPTYNRPEYLERCFRSVLSQTHIPNEIILVSRITDIATNKKISMIQDEFGKIIPVLNLNVSRPGFLPPIQRGIDAAKNDIIVFLDDDAEAFPDWLERIIARYDTPSVGGVGGRYINYFDFKVVDYPTAVKVGHLSWYGRNVGNMYKPTNFTNPVEVDFFMGGNMSFRRELLNKIKIDSIIDKNVAFHWELDVAQQVKKLGYKLLFDPMIRVNHYSAPREIDGLRSINYDGVYYSNFNYAYLMMKHLPIVGRLAYIVYSFMIGSQLSSGLLHILVKLVSHRPIDWINDILSSIRGRLAGIAAYVRQSVS